MSELTSAILIVDDDPSVREGLALLLEQRERLVVLCNDPDAAIEVASSYNPSLAFVDIKYSGPFGFEGLTLIEELQSLVPGMHIVAISGDANDELRREASSRGAAGFLCKPFGGAEIEPFLAGTPPGIGITGSTVRVPSIDEVLGDGLLAMHYQPIVALNGREVVGWEALARVATPTPFRLPDRLFHYARRRDRSFDLNLACAVAAIESGAALSHRAKLFINVDPDVLPRGEELVAAVTDAATRSGVAMESVVFEVTERHQIATSALGALDSLRATGAAIAFDDLGISYTHFPQLAAIQPAFMKIAQEFGIGLAGDPTRQAIVRHLRDLASSFDCRLILEGIETAADAALAAEIGVELGQGYHFGRPAPASTF
jgi:EAL domain-containing protein (putative c-di-GMP-specific phosphodiesterase class I)/ActR/RegA family two-component response regulator